MRFIDRGEGWDIMDISCSGENWIGREARKMKQKKRKSSLDVRLGKRTKLSPDLLEEEEKCPCFLGDFFRVEGGPVVYLFKLNEKKKHHDPGMTVITPSKSRWNPKGSIYVVVGSVVYVLGGLFEDLEEEERYIFSSKVFYFDTNNLCSEEQSWVRGPDMLNGRFDGKGVTVEGKIYVFGGVDPNDDSNRRPWAEVLDPTGNNKWEPLPPPASPDSPHFYMESLFNVPVFAYGGTYEEKKILLHCCRSIYHVNSKTWEKFPCSEPSVGFTANLTAVGNLLYWTSMGILHTFDTETEEFLSAAIEGFSISKHQKDFLHPEPALLHLGRGSFCLITLKDLDPDLLLGGRTKVHCSKFRVSRTGGGFKASIVCHEAYTVDHPLDISGAVVLDEGWDMMDISGSGENWIGREARKKKQKKRGRRKGSLDVRLGKRTKSSPDLLEEEEKCPCFLGDFFRDEGGPVVYLFKLDEKRKHHDPGMTVITPSKSRWNPKGSIYVVVGSVVYVLGGLFEDPEEGGRCILSSKVFYFDTDNLRSEEHGWVRGPDMLNGRFDGKGVTVEGRIYVFGGVYSIDDSNLRPWAEVLDPMGNNKWEPLPLPPPASPTPCYFHDKSLFSVPMFTYGGTYEEKKIFLHCCRSIYHVNSKTWEKFPCSEPSVGFTANLTAVGNLLFWTSMGILHTFDTKTEEFLSAAIEGFSITKHQKDFLDPEPALLHLGRGNFCLITLKYLDPDLHLGGRTKVRCSKFRISRTGGGFKASIVCHRAYIVDLPLDISGAFVL